MAEKKEDLPRIISALLAKYGYFAVERAYSEAVRKEVQRQLEDRYGPATGNSYVSTLLPYPQELLYHSDCYSLRSDWEWQTVPGQDHTMVHENTGGKTFISQPYRLAWEELVGLVAFCQRNNLEAWIQAGGPHFPTRCLCVQVLQPGTFKWGARG